MFLENRILRVISTKTAEWEVLGATSLHKETKQQLSTDMNASVKISEPGGEVEHPLEEQEPRKAISEGLNGAVFTLTTLPLHQAGPDPLLSCLMGNSGRTGRDDIPGSARKRELGGAHSDQHMDPGSGTTSLPVIPFDKISVLKRAVLLHYYSCSQEKIGRAHV